jgi:hypothetical protein
MYVNRFTSTWTFGGLGETSVAHSCHKPRERRECENPQEAIVELSLPEDVRAALRDEGIGEDDVLLMTGDDLRQVIGGQLTYDLAVALAGQKLGIARRPGERGKLPQAHLIERNLDILKLRLVDGLTYAAIGRAVGLTNSRVSELLRNYFGVDAREPHGERVRILYVPAADVPILRDALLGRLLGTAEDLTATLSAGDEGWYAAWSSTQDVVWLLLEVQKDKDTEINVGKAQKRKSIITRALRDQAEVERHLDHEDGAAVCDRLLAATP